MCQSEALYANVWLHQLVYLHFENHAYKLTLEDDYRKYQILHTHEFTNCLGDNQSSSSVNLQGCLIVILSYFVNASWQPVVKQHLSFQ